MQDLVRNQIHDGIRAAAELCQVADRMRELLSVISVSTNILGGSMITTHPELHRSLAHLNRISSHTLLFFREKSLLSYGYDVRQRLFEAARLLEDR